MSSTFLIQNGDAVVGANGQPQTVSGNAKANQDTKEMLSIKLQQSGFGAGIVDIVGSDFQSDNGMGANIEYTIRDRLSSAVSRFIALQQSSMSNRTLDELIARILNLQVFRSNTDPTLFFWRVDLQTFNGETLTLSGKVVS